MYELLHEKFLFKQHKEFNQLLRYSYLYKKSHVLWSRTGVGNFSSRRARFTEENSSRATLKAKVPFLAIVLLKNFT